MQRPDQPRFDYFSRCFEQIDNDLNEFCQRCRWELIVNPHRLPGRNLVKYDRMRLIIGVALEGDWQRLDFGADTHYYASISGTFQPFSDLAFYRETVMFDHMPFDTLQKELQTILRLGPQIADTWELPHQTEKGHFTIPEGWE